MKPDPKPIRVEPKKMTAAEFRQKYGKTKIKRTGVKVRKSKTPRQNLIADADTWFSRRVRLEAADKNGIGYCIDCKKLVDIKKADAGHFYSRRHYATRWDINNVHLQKKKCNWDMGKPETNDGYRNNLIEKIGPAEFEKLDFKRRNLWKPAPWELQHIIDENKARVSYLLHKKNLKKWW